TTLRLGRIYIKLHPPILPRNVPLPMHHHRPQSGTRIRHQMLSPKIIPRIHERRHRHHHQNHPLQNSTRSHSAPTPSRSPSLTPSPSHRFSRLQHQSAPLGTTQFAPELPYSTSA